MKKILLSPLLIIVLIVLVGVGVAGAAIYFGGFGGTEEVNSQKGLVGWWKMDGNAKDATSNSNHGTVTGATLTADRKDQSNKAYNFGGSDDIAVPDSSALEPTDEVTIEFWVRPD